MDRLTSLTVFSRVVETGGFSAAARRLNMSVTAVSNHVQALERHLGVRLLNRTTRRISLTEIGRAYHERISGVLTELDEADRLASVLDAEPRGTLRLYSNVALARFLAPVVAEFLELHAEVSVDLTVGERAVDLVEEGYDLMIRTLPVPSSGVMMRQLARYRHLLCCSPAYLQRHEAPASLADIAAHNCLQYAFYPFGREWRFEGPNGEPQSVRVHGNLTTSSADALRLLAVGGHGLLFAPTFLVAGDLASGALIEPLPHLRGVQHTISAFFPHRHQMSAKVRRFIDLLAERFTAHRRWMDPEEAAAG